MSKESCQFLYREDTMKIRQVLFPMQILLYLHGIILDGNLQNVEGKYAFSDFAEKNTICDCLRSS